MARRRGRVLRLLLLGGLFLLFCKNQLLQATQLAACEDRAPSSPGAALDDCDAAFDRVTNNTNLEHLFNRTTTNTHYHLDDEVYERSVANVGNRHRLGRMVQKLAARKSAAHVVVCGGSISVGHGVANARQNRYASRLQAWLNTHYPLSSSENEQHTVLARAAHGADMCAMAKRLNFFEFPSGFAPDLFVLEFGVNDYQGQDHVKYVRHITDVFFDHFRELALCAEAVVHRLLAKYPNAAVMFLEFQTAVLNRKTAQFLHMGVAQHYQVPVLSYADALFPHVYELFETLRPSAYAIPNAVANNNPVQNQVQAFPHGCGPCYPELIHVQFANQGCKSLCQMAAKSRLYQGKCAPSNSTLSCHMPLFAHDEVHPSAIGHQVAADLLTHFLADTARTLCHRRHYHDDASFHRHLLPQHSGWLVPGSDYQQELKRLSDFEVVWDTTEVYSKRKPLVPLNHSTGFYFPTTGRAGWIADTVAGGEFITFDTNLAYRAAGYDVLISVLRSYETVGTFTATVTDLRRTSDDPTAAVPLVFDCQWEPRISIPSDFLLTPPQEGAACTGQCLITIFTNPQVPGRSSNQIKITALAVRKAKDL